MFHPSGPLNWTVNFSRRRRCVPACLALLLLVTCSAAAPEDASNADDGTGRRTASATNLLNRLYEAAKERADNIRKAEGTGPGLPRNKDMLSSLLDYTSDKLQNPPLRSTELNFVAVRRDIAVLRDEIKRLNELVRETRAQCGAEGQQKGSGWETKSALEALPTKLVPIQSKSKSILNNNNKH